MCSIILYCFIVSCEKLWKILVQCELHLIQLYNIQTNKIKNTANPEFENLLQNKNYTYRQ